MSDNRESNVTNLFATVLSSQVGPTDLTYSVDSLDGAPTSPCFITIRSTDGSQVEFIDCDGTFGASSFSSSGIGKRYLAGSSAQSGLTHETGSVVEVRWTAQNAQQLHDRIDAVEDGDFVSDGSLPMTGQLQAFPGTEASPGLTWDGDENTGFSRSGEGEMMVSQNGTESWSWLTDRVSFTQVLAGPDGTLAFPTYSFSGKRNTGFWLSGSDLILSTNATRVIECRSSQLNIFPNGASGERFEFGSWGMRPGVDNLSNLGTVSKRIDTVNTVNGVTSTSDETTKEEIEDTPLGLDFILALRPIRFRRKGGTRKHDGLSAQQVRQALTDVGIEDAALYVDPSVKADRDGRPKRKDFSEDRDHAEAVAEWNAEKSAPKSLNYNEMIGPLVRAIQDQQVLIGQLTARLDALEASR